MSEALFLPGAGGSERYWMPVALLLGWCSDLISWPGLGNEPPDPSVNCIDDLLDLIAKKVEKPKPIIAQSMGGYVAMKFALQNPGLVPYLVLVATSGGLPVRQMGGEDWQAHYFSQFPHAARWISQPLDDLTSKIEGLEAPVLLIWGDTDPISPVSVGEMLFSLLPKARLEVVKGAGHDIALTHTKEVADLIRQYVETV